MATSGEANTRAENQGQERSNVGEWKTVTRRKGYPAHWRSAPATKPTVKTYQPYQPHPTYAEILRRNTPSPARREGRRSSPPSNRSTSPPTPTNTSFYISPHSPSRLRFPPSPKFTEWRGRCFRYCRQGHIAVQCRNPKKYGKCWGEGHIGNNCKEVMVSPVTMPYWGSTAQPKTKTAGGEPRFDDILSGDYPRIPKPLSEERPQKSYCFIKRDDELFSKMAKLEGAVVLNAQKMEVAPTIDQVAHFATKTGPVSTEEITVGKLSDCRYLILLPQGLATETFIKAMPIEIWRDGATFSQWSPLMYSTVIVPKFKVLLDLVGIPVQLCRERDIIRATTAFGTYLGSVEQSCVEKISTWTVVVATHDLALSFLEALHLLWVA